MDEPIFQRRVWWPTPIVVVELTEAARLNDALARIILEKEREVLAQATPTAVAGIDHGLTSHWLEYNVLNWEYPEIQEFAGLVLHGAKEFMTHVGAVDEHGEDAIAGISCWANVLRHGESLEIHHHDPAFVSAHYTVRSGRTQDGNGQGDSGNTVYYRPGFIDRSQGDSTFGGPWDGDWRISVPPRDGRMTLFPSYVRHEVKAHLGPGERISIAMDIYTRKQRVPFYFAPPRWHVPQPMVVR